MESMLTPQYIFYWVHEPHVALRRLPQRDEVLLGRPAPHHHRLAEEAFAVGVVGDRVPGGGLV